MLKIKNLYKSFKHSKALNGLDMYIEEGSIYGLVGQNGAGKTTLMKLISGLLSFEVGEIYIDGLDMKKHYTAIKSKISYVPDNFSFHEQMSVIEYMEFFSSCYGLYGLKARARYTELLDILALSDKTDMSVLSLSRGMQQRLLLARALINEPKLILMDEPTSGLDPRTGYSFKEIIRQLNSEGKTIMISSHILSELAELCTDIGIIDKGSMIVEGSLSDILNKFSNANPIKMRLIEGADKAFKIFREEECVKHVSAKNDIFYIKFTGSKRQEAELLKRLVSEGVLFSEFVREEASLESFFMDITADKDERTIIENDY